jgi:uncharacterized protein YndB with AHSA1/START domain
MLIKQMPAPPSQLKIIAETADFIPGELFSYWTEPVLLTLWWPQEAEVDPRPGGSYHFSWPVMGWHLRGAYLAFRPGAELSFTWKWDHEPGEPQRTVTVRFEPLPGRGTRMTVTHGEYDYPRETQARQEHLDGWLLFLENLLKVKGDRPPAAG